jgi:hypothetical protein
MLIEGRRNLYINFCQLRLEPIDPGGVEIWDKIPSNGWNLGFGGERGYFILEGIILWSWEVNQS